MTFAFIKNKHIKGDWNATCWTTILFQLYLCNKKKNPLNLPPGSSSPSTASYTLKTCDTVPHTLSHWPVDQVQTLVTEAKVHHVPASAPYCRLVVCSSQSFALARAVYASFPGPMKQFVAWCMPFPAWDAITSLSDLSQPHSSSKFLFRGRVTSLISRCTTLHTRGSLLLCLPKRATGVLERVWAPEPHK